MHSTLIDPEDNMSFNPGDKISLTFSDGKVGMYEITDTVIKSGVDIAPNKRKSLLNSLLERFTNGLNH